MTRARMLFAALASLLTLVASGCATPIEIPLHGDASSSGRYDRGISARDATPAKVADGGAERFDSGQVMPAVDASAPTPDNEAGPTRDASLGDGLPGDAAVADALGDALLGDAAADDGGAPLADAASSD